MNQLYQDSMAIIREHGKPDLFITFTCNPNWPEIVQTTNEQHTTNRSDVISRVFRLKLEALLNDIMKDGVLGRVVAHIHVIEFQVRYRSRPLTHPP